MLGNGFSKFYVVILGFILLLPSKMDAFIDYPYASQLQTVRRPLIPLNESGQDAGTLSGRMSFRWMNVWAYSNNRYLIDGEEFQAEITLKYSWSRKFTVGAAIPGIFQGGGTLDSSVEAFHRSTGVTQSHRENFSRNTLNVSYEPLGRIYPLIDKNPWETWLRLNQNRVYPRNPSDPPLTFADIQNSLLKDYVIFKYPDLVGKPTTEVIGLSATDRAATGNSRLFTEYSFLQTGHNRFFSGLQLKVPYREVYYLSTPGWDKSVYFVHQYEMNGSTQLTTGISYTQFEYMKFPYIALPRDQWVFRTEANFRLENGYFFNMEYLVFSKPVNDMGKLSQPGHMISLVLEKRTEKRKMTFAIIEDIINFNNTPDIGFMASIESWM